MSDVDLEEFYAYPDQPWLRTDFVSSLDGAAWSADGTSGNFGGDADKAAFSMMRSLADVIVVGAGTARDEGYKPLKPASVNQEVRQRHGLSPAPTLLVVSRSLAVPESLIAGGAVVLTCAAANSQPLAALQERTDVIVAGVDTIDWASAREAFADRGWQRILCEGGPALHGDLLAAGAVDEICLTIAPVVASGTAGRIAVHELPIDRPARLAGVHQIDNVLLTRWHVQQA